MTPMIFVDLKNYEESNISLNKLIILCCFYSIGL